MKFLTLFLLLSACAAASPTPHATGVQGDAHPIVSDRRETHGRARPLPPLVTPDTGGPVRGGPGGEDIWRPGKGWTPVRGAMQ